MDVWGFEEGNITVLMDDGEHENPTRENILGAYKKIVEESQPGDVVFCHYSGKSFVVRYLASLESSGTCPTCALHDY